MAGVQQEHNKRTIEKDLPPPQKKSNLFLFFVFFWSIFVLVFFK